MMEMGIEEEAEATQSGGGGITDARGGGLAKEGMESTVAWNGFIGSHDGFREDTEAVVLSKPLLANCHGAGKQGSKFDCKKTRV
jgi:hypothetical protein